MIVKIKSYSFHKNILVIITSRQEDMESVTKKKLNQYRVQIRKQELQSYKRSRRKEMLQSYRMGDLDQLQKTFMHVLNLTVLQNIQYMNENTLENHLQMLNEIVFAEHGYKFKHHFEKVIMVMVEYFQKAYINWIQQGKNRLGQFVFEYHNMDEALSIYALCNIYSFLQANQLFKLILGVYFQIIPTNMVGLEKVVQIARQTLFFSFKDSQTIKTILNGFNSNINPMINKSIDKKRILTSLMNMTYCEDDLVMQIIYKNNIFQQLIELLQVYGLSDAEKEPLAGLYRNSIDYLYERAQANIQVEEGCQSSSINTYELLIPLFEQLVTSLNPDIMQNLVQVSIVLLKAVDRFDQFSKEQVLNQIVNLIRNIEVNKQYLEGCENLLILMVEHITWKTPFFAGWVTDFLQLIFNNYLVSYEGQLQKKTKSLDNQNSRSLRVLTNIKKLIQTSQWLLQNSTFDNQQVIVDYMLDFWCKTQLIMGSVEFTSFLRTAIEISQELSKVIIFEKYSQQFLSFLSRGWEDMSQVEQKIKCLNILAGRLEQAESNQLVSYFNHNSQQWKNIMIHLENYKYFQNKQFRNDLQQLFKRYETLMPRQQL